MRNETVERETDEKKKKKGEKKKKKEARSADAGCY
jgi:hypothetical protein